MSSKKWFPLEANPDVMNIYTESLGVGSADAPLPISFHDVYGLDDEMLGFVPQPVIAVVFLYPINDANEALRFEGNFLPADEQAGLFYTKQTVSNACGTIGILHALLNNVEKLGPLKDGSILSDFASKLPSLTPDERAKVIENSSDLDSVQSGAAQMGQTENQSIDADINLHFVCFVHHNGKCVELDGRKKGPLVVGECTPETLLKASATQIQAYAALSPDSVQFSIIALAGVPAS
ncbi:ubiquitin carboxyl-terminal hydrolase, putative [Bodo saltans]|uniref:Ubiquitin carboxyl-terminal hydrolase n=1 Tax=Bodo saltans TaxID=75058 RepID=A0A0S4JHD6_BODSA|nr:ubiquitin carboxyl-terminal hydrolase, putative [Bodo saltans]|eukprot:CUG89657.1 ubiquitin carboxyl-terminal hydrolase, putative [Bodo saltans]